MTATSEPQEARRTGDGSPPGEKGLKRDAISYVSNVVVATASTAPAYRLIGLACVIYDRRILLRSVGTFFSAGMLPRLGFLALVAVFVKAFHDYSQAGFNYSAPLLGVQVPFVIGIGNLLAGGVLMLWASAVYRGFFRRRREVASQESPTRARRCGSVERDG